jgi:hypothetical protein
LKQYEPKTLITRFFEAAALFALSGFLIRLGVGFVLEVLPVMAVLASVVTAAIVTYRIRRHKNRW